MRILLVEPAYRRTALPKASNITHTDGMENLKPYGEDDTRWYPPLGLLKLARFHKQRGDYVQFVSGCDRTLQDQGLWDRIYVTTLFTCLLYTSDAADE